MSNKTILERTLVNPETEHLHKKEYPDHWERYEWAAQFVKGKQIVDIACGPGYGTTLLSVISGVKAIGLDVDEQTVNAATINYGDKATFRAINGYNWELDSESVDIVVSMETFEHLDDTDAFLKEAQRVLVSGGLLILSTPLNETESRFSPINPFHIREYTWQELGDNISKFFQIQERYSQISKMGTFSQNISKNRLSFLKELVPTSIKKWITGSLNDLGMKKGKIETGFIKNAGVQIVVAVKR